MMNEMKTVIDYTDIVMMVHESIKDVSDDNGCEFDTNLELYLEGLKEDVYEVEAGKEPGCRPKEQQDVDDYEG
jgi:hypothetical protein